MNKAGLLFVICLWINMTCCTNKKTTDSIVYITNTGNKYHTSVCRYLGKSAFPVSLEDACSRHYGPCSDCTPPVCRVVIAAKDSFAAPVRSPGENINSEKTAIRCSGITQKGKQCKRKTNDADGRCFQHKK